MWLSEVPLPETERERSSYLAGCVYDRVSRKEDPVETIFTQGTDKVLTPAAFIATIWTGKSVYSYDIHTSKFYVVWEIGNPVTLTRGKNKEFFLDIEMPTKEVWNGMTDGGLLKGSIPENVALFASRIREASIEDSDVVRVIGRAPIWAYWVCVSMLAEAGVPIIGWVLPEGSVEIPNQTKEESKQ